jgi:hypothetical protein
VSHIAPRRHDAPWRRLLHSGAGRLALWGVLMLLAAAAAATVLVPQWRAEAALWQARAQAQPPATRSAEPTWPEAQTHAARVRTLLGLARRHGVVVRAMRDDPSRAPGAEGTASPQWRLLTMSAEGGYAALRGFVASALVADPALALDALVMQRGDGQTAQLRAEFSWAFASTPGAANSAPIPRARP